MLHCALLPGRDGLYYSEDELVVLEETLDIIGYGHGYDDDIELDYIYSYSYSSANFNKKEKQFVKYINKIELGKVIALYEKILRLHLMTYYKMNEYKKDTDWKYYTYIKNDLYEPLENYMGLLHKYILKRDPSLNEMLNKRKETLRKEIVDSM